jgi:hypothetical protein
MDEIVRANRTSVCVSIVLDEPAQSEGQSWKPPEIQRRLGARSEAGGLLQHARIVSFFRDSLNLAIIGTVARRQW